MFSNRHNDFQPLTDTITAPTGLTSATGAGIALGTGDASKAMCDAVGVSSERTFHRDQLLAALDALIKRKEAPDNIEALKIFGELKDSLGGTARVIRTGVASSAIAPSVTLSEGLQLFVDSASAVSAVSQSTDDAKKFIQLQASTLHVQKELELNASGFSAHCKNLSKEFGPIFDEMSKQVDAKELGGSHGSIAKSTGATSVMTVLSPAALVSSGLDAIGTVFRECSAVKIFIVDESASKEEKNIYKALSACSDAFSDSKNFQASLQALKNLRDAIWNVEHASHMSDKHSVSSPATSAILRGFSSTPFVCALESVISSGEAVRLSSEALTKQKQALSESAQQSIFKASSIKGQSEGGDTHSQNITILTDRFERVIKDLDDQIADNTQKSVVENSATLSVRTLSALSAVPSLMLALVGSLTREVSGTVHDVSHGSGTGDQLRDVSKSELNRSANNLDKLMSKVSELQQRVDRCKELGVSAPFVLGIAEMASFGTMFPAFSALQSSVVSIAGVQASSFALFLNKDQLTDGDCKKSASDASTLKQQAEGQEKHTHSQNLSRLTEKFAVVGKQIDVGLQQMEGERHKSSAISYGQTSLHTISALIALPILMTDLVGALSRESSGTFYFVQEGSGTADQLKKVSKTDMNHSANDIDELMSEVSNMNHRIKRCEELGVSAPFVLGTSQTISFGSMYPAVSALQSSIASFAGAEASSHALTKEKALLTGETKASISDASTLKKEMEGQAKQTHSQNLSHSIAHFAVVAKHINDELKEMAEGRHKVSAKSTGVCMIRTLSALNAIPNFIIAATGMLSREASGTADFITNDKATHQVLTRVLKSDKDHTGKDLDDLMSAVCEMKERVAKCQRLGISAPFILGTSHVVSCGSLIASLNTLAGMIFALREFRTVTHPEASPALKLNEDEIQDAKKSKDDIINSNQSSAASLKTQSVSQHISLHDHLQSVMEKIVLTHRVSFDFAQPGAENINKSGHSLINTTQMNTSGFLSGALGVLACIALETGISTEAFWRALSLAIEKSHVLSKGPDEIKIGGTSQFNLSIPSNATRLTADQSKDPGSSATQTVLSATYHVAESISSRSLVVAICQSGALTQALKELSAEADVREGEERPKYFSNTSVILGRIKSDQLAKKIREVLDRVGNDIPGLNHDMENQLASASQTSINAALSSHSVLIAPFLQSYLVAKDATKNIHAEQKKEALSESSIMRELTTASNTIRAFTKNCIAELQLNADQISDEQQKDDAYNSSMQTHIKLNASVATTMVAGCYMSLLCDDLVESIVSRSILGFLDAEKMRKTAKQSGDVSAGEAKESSKETAQDSNLGELNSVTLMISALRLTLTHIGESLAGMASELEKQLKDIDLLKDDMNMHSSQRSILESMMSALTQCSLNMSKTASILTMLPLGSLGSLDAMRHIVRSIDCAISNHSNSAESTRNSEGSESSVSFGLTTDSTTATILLFIKSLLKGLVIGSEASLLVCKLFEILSLHPRPDVALSLLVAELLQPQGGLLGLSKLSGSQLTGTMVGLSGGSISILDVMNTSDSDSFKSTRDSSQQQVIDKLIDACGFLEDSEENQQEKLGLKKFFELLIIVLANHAKHSKAFKDDDITPRNAQSIVAMLNRGSLALASFHSKTDKNNSLISDETFLGCNDAQVLLETFIRKASKDEALLMALKEALQNQGKNYSAKVEGRWKYIVDKICEHLSTQSRSDRLFLPGAYYSEKRFNQKAFRAKCALDEKRDNKLSSPHIG